MLPKSDSSSAFLAGTRLRARRVAPRGCPLFDPDPPKHGDCFDLLTAGIFRQFHALQGHGDDVTVIQVTGPSSSFIPAQEVLS